LKSGSKKRPTAQPPELTPWQVKVVDLIARDPLAKVVTFGGGTALSAAYLHHRLSEDIDFFSLREIQQYEIASFAKALNAAGFIVNQEVTGPRRKLALLKNKRAVGHVDLSFYPFDPIDRPTQWHGLRVDSLLDMTVNKVQAVLTRAKARDYLDLYFMLREGPETNLERLLSYVRAKFDTGADALVLADRFLEASEIEELPKMIRPVRLNDMVRGFEQLARKLMRR
jgi:predicted nucleotidyltransferase component of viral defense system